MNIEEILANAQGTIVDVRTPEEFQSGNAQNHSSCYATTNN